MINKMLIIIPSRNRAKWLHSCKHHTLKTTGYLKPEFWVREDDPELEDYKKYYNRYAVDDPEMINFKVYDGTNILGAAQTYDLIIDSAIEQGYKHLMILDDDLTFSMRNPILGAKPDYKKCTEEELSFLFKESLKLVCSEAPLMSFTPIMTRTQPNIIQYCKPMMMAYVYYLPHFKEHLEHRFWKGKVIEARCDLNLTLSLLTQGYLTAFNNTLFIPDNVNNPGGCSTYRDINFERASVQYLKEHYPKVVTTRMKRGWLGNPELLREAPFIQWKRSFNKDAFRENFGYDANKFAAKRIINFEKVYSEFIRSIRNANNKN